MKLKNIIREKIVHNRFFCFVYVPFVALIFTIGFLLLSYPAVASDGVKKGIDICLNELIPTLFPFMLISLISVDIGVFNIKNRFIDKICRFLFKMPGNAFPIIILSMIGGFPLGAILIRRAYENGELTLNQGRRLLLFCVNPAPSFLISTVGCTLYNSESVGLILYASSLVSALILGILSRFFCEVDGLHGFRCQKKIDKLTDVVNNCVNSAVHNMMNMCVWVVLFSCFGELLDLLINDSNISSFVKMISEVTNGVYSACESSDLPVVSAVIGFTGLCVHFQVMPSLTIMKLKYKYFLASRIICAAFNCILCYLLLDCFSVTVSVISINTKPEKLSMASSIPLCVCLMLMCGLFVAGDALIFIKNKKKIAGNKTQLY